MKKNPVHFTQVVVYSDKKKILPVYLYNDRQIHKKSPCDSTNCAGHDIHPIHSVWSLILLDDKHMLITLRFYNRQDLNNV